MKCYYQLTNKYGFIQTKVIEMKGLQTVLKNEEAARLLNYFISYKEMITKTETKNEDSLSLGALPKPEEIMIK